MTETLLMKNLLHTPKPPVPGHYRSENKFEILLTSILLASVLGILASASIFGAILSGNVFSHNDVVSLISIIVVLTVACTCAWLGIHVALRKAQCQDAAIKTILNNVSDGMLLLDLQGNFVSANPALFQIMPEEKLREIYAHPLEESIRYEHAVVTIRIKTLPGAGSLVICRAENIRHQKEKPRGSASYHFA